MKKISTITLFLLLGISFSNAQEHQAHGGEHHHHHNGECVSKSQYKKIHAKLAKNRLELVDKGILPATKTKTRAPKFIWPLRQADGFNYNSYYGISNFVDHNPAYPDKVTDYECKQRTYDLSGGYNHQGTDIYLWPFDWNMVEVDQVEVIVAADGKIIGKDDGNYDKNCDFSSPNWNAVYVEHSDGSVTWYGHLKKNSLTSKAVGETVKAGEYLGIVASSGSSTGPHLHFEVYNSSGDLVDPYVGSCNGTTTESWWQDQKPYYEPTINALLTHSAPPSFSDCPNPDVTNESTEFDLGDKIYFAAYYHDQLDTSPSTYKIFRPDGTEYANWTHTSNSSFYSSSFWYWWYDMPLDEQEGVWTFEVTYEGNTVQHQFIYGEAPDVTSLNDNVEDEVFKVISATDEGITLQYLGKSNESYKAVLTTINGQKTTFKLDQLSPQKSQKLSWSNYSTGVYMLFITNEKTGKSSSFKLFKK